MSASLYINSKGYRVTRHSYSGSESFSTCARKYYLERVQGWSEKENRSSKHFGIALEAAITFYHQRGMDVVASVAEFNRLWAEHKDKPYTYNKTDVDWNRLSLNGQDFVKLYAIRYPSFPYIVPNPKDDFQIEINFEVFPGTKLAGIEFNGYIDLLAQFKATFEPLIVDMKTSGKDVPELTILDPQLRSYAWAKRRNETDPVRVAFLWFRKMGRKIDGGDWVTFLEAYAGFQPGEEACVLATDDFGLWVVPNAAIREQMQKQFVGTKKEVVAARQAFVEANAKHSPVEKVTKQQIQFKHVVISPESSTDIGRLIKKTIIEIVAATENDYFPMQSGVRFPHEVCTHCQMRGICSDNPELRDMLVVRKQMEEIEFGQDSE